MHPERHRTFAVCVASAALAGQPVAGHANPAQFTTPEQLRAWLKALFIDPAPPADIRVAIETSTTLSWQQASQRWAQIERFVDHPERATLSRAMSLAQAPEKVLLHIVWSDPLAWHRAEQTGDHSLRAGGTPEARWMLFARDVPKQLTIIGAGKPFPAVFDAGRFATLAEDEVRRWAMFSAPRWDDAQVSGLTLSGGNWHATVNSAARGSNVRVEGGFEPSTQSPVIQRLVVASAAGQAQTTIELSGFRPGPAGTSWPSRIVERSDAPFVEVRTLESASAVDPAILSRLAAVPTDATAARMLDFRRDDPSQWAGHEQAQRITWNPEPPTAQRSEPAANPEPASRSRPMPGPAFGPFWPAVVAVVAVVAISVVIRVRTRSH